MMKSIRLTRREIGFLVACAAVMIIGLAVWSWASEVEVNPQVDPWPVTVRTVDGVVTTPMPEDLDR